MMSIRDLEELDESLHAMGVSNMDALQRARALLDHAASKKQNASDHHSEVNQLQNPTDNLRQKSNDNIKSSDTNDDEDGDEDDDYDIHSDTLNQYDHNSLIHEIMQDEDLVHAMKNINIQTSEDSLTIQHLRIHSPMNEVWGKRLDDLSSPSVSLATISEDDEHHGNSDDEESTLDRHDRFYVHDALDIAATRSGGSDIIFKASANETLSQPQKYLNASNTWDDDDLSVESVDNNVLMERFKLLESTKLSLLNQCSYLESKLERKISKLIRVEEQKKELELRLQHIEEDNRDDMKDVMMKMNVMEISYQERIISQEKKIQSLEAELKALKAENISHGSDRTNDTTVHTPNDIPSEDTTTALTTKYSTGTWLLSRRKAIAKNVI